MKRITAMVCFVSACIFSAYADNMIRLRCGASFREITPKKCFSEHRTKTIDGVTYTYRIFKTTLRGSGLFEDSNGAFEAPIGLTINKAEFPSSKKRITIPASIDGVPVVEIGFACFEGRSRLKSVAVPKSVISIDGNIGSLGGGAFEGCTSLETITAPSTLVNVGSRAFKGCRSLKTNFVFDKDVDIGQEAFCGCHEITSIRFNKGINSFQRPHSGQRDDFNDIKPGTFADCRKLSDFDLPPNTRRIGYMISGVTGPFSNCCSLARITFPKRLEGIGWYSFADCKALTEIEIPAGTKILSGAFSGCAALKSVKLPANMEEIPSCLFMNCAALEAISLPNGIKELEDSAFAECSKLKSIVIPNHATRIGVSCFEGCSSLQMVELPQHLDNIKARAFKDCANLESLNLPPALTTIGGQAFEGCRKLSRVEIPPSVGKFGKNSVGGIGQWAFRGCEALKSLKLHDGCGCASDAFAGLCGLEEVDAPADLRESQSVPEAYVRTRQYAHYRFDFKRNFPDSANIVKVNLRKMTLRCCAGDIKSIDGFRGLEKLRSLTLPDGVEEICSSAFEGCSSLSDVALPGSVKAIRSNAFAGCTSLKTINLPKGVEIDRGAFKGCPAYTDPREEVERQARAAAEVAKREKAAKEASERQACEQERKARAEEKKRREEQKRKKWQEEEARREKENAEREKRLEELNKRLSKINDDVASKINDAQSGGSGSFCCLL